MNFAFEGRVNQELGQNSMVHRGFNQKTETMANTGDPGTVFPHCICISLACIALKQHSDVGGIIRPCLALMLFFLKEAHWVF